MQQLRAFDLLLYYRTNGQPGRKKTPMLENCLSWGVANAQRAPALKLAVAKGNPFLPRLKARGLLDLF